MAFFPALTMLHWHPMDRARTPIPKLDDVAQRAGVSTATVSRYYNNPAIVAPATAARIRAAIDEMGYVPNLLAGGLASNRSRLVAVLVPEIAQSIFNDTIEAMASELSLDGNTVMLGLSGAGNARMPQLIEAAHSWAAQHEYETFRVECHNSHRPMMHLAIELGYDVVGMRWDADRGDNLVLFEKSLTGGR